MIPIASTIRSRVQPAKQLSKTCPSSPRPILRLGSRSLCAGQHATQPCEDVRTPFRRARTVSTGASGYETDDRTITESSLLEKARARQVGQHRAGSEKVASE